MDAKRNASGCRFGATGSYGEESSMSPPEMTARRGRVIIAHVSDAHTAVERQSVEEHNQTWAA